MYKPDMKIPGEALNPPVKETMGHGRVQQGRDHATVHDPVVPLQYSIHSEIRPDNTIGSRPERQPEGPGIQAATQQATGVIIMTTER